MKASRKYVTLILITILFFIQAFTLKPAEIPVSGINLAQNELLSDLLVIDPERFDSPHKSSNAEENTHKTLKISEFLKFVIDGNSGVIRGIFAEDRFALNVIQQPSGQPGFVSSIDEVVTEFEMSRDYGVTGLMAHNYLAGEYFLNLQEGDIVQIIFGDGKIKRYAISDIQRFQALQPNSPRSQFLDLATSEQISATQLFKRVYMGDHHLTLQTCIQEGSVDTWGRMFVIAEQI